MQYPYHIRDIHISDPFILADPVSKRYYTYVQFVDADRFPHLIDGEKHFYVLASEDLIHWTEPAVCFTQGDFWAGLDYWAPEVHLYRGKYYLISSFRAPGTYRYCQCLVADSPVGPFKPIEDKPVTPKGWQSLDGTLYVDRFGKPFMVFVHEWLQVNDGQIAVIPLSDDLGHAIGPAEILFRASDGPWAGRRVDNGTAGFVTDGPFLYRTKDRTLLMLWSSFTASGAYAVGVARSLSGEITGPWQQEEFPLYWMDGGHAMLFETFDGRLMMSMHCPNDHARKRILLFEMGEKNNKLHIINEFTGNWYQGIGGPAARYAYKEKLVEEPCFSDTVESVWKWY